MLTGRIRERRQRTGGRTRGVGVLTEMTRMARRPLPRLVHSSRSRAEFRDAPRSRGAASRDADRSRPSSGSPPPGDDQTPSRKPRTIPGSVSVPSPSSPPPETATSTGRAAEAASPLAAG